MSAKKLFKPKINHRKSRKIIPHWGGDINDIKSYVLSFDKQNSLIPGSTIVNGERV